MTPDEFSDVASFCERARKMQSIQKKYRRIPISRSTHIESQGQIAFEANTPDEEEVASLARNFRFFYADNEPTQFKKILTKVRRRTQDEWAHSYLDLLSTHYKIAMKDVQISKSCGYPVSNKEIIDLWFNSEFFHSDPSKRQRLSAINSAIGETASLFQLYIAILRSSSSIHNLYLIVHLLEPEHQFIYSPNHEFKV